MYLKFFFLPQGSRDVIRLKREKHADSVAEQHLKAGFFVWCLPLGPQLQPFTVHLFFSTGSSKRRRSSFSGDHSSNDEFNEGADSPSGVQGDNHSPSVRKQPKRVVKPRVYFDLVDYDSDFDDKAESASSPARKRGTGSRFSEGNKIQTRQTLHQRLATDHTISKIFSPNNWLLHL